MCQIQNIIILYYIEVIVSFLFVCFIEGFRFHFSPLKKIIHHQEVFMILKFKTERRNALQQENIFFLPNNFSEFPLSS